MDLLVDPSTVAMHLTSQVEWQFFVNCLQQYHIICFLTVSRTAMKLFFAVVKA